MYVARQDACGQLDPVSQKPEMQSVIFHVVCMPFTPALVPLLMHSSSLPSVRPSVLVPGSAVGAVHSYWPCTTMTPDVC